MRTYERVTPFPYRTAIFWVWAMVGFYVISMHRHNLFMETGLTKTQEILFQTLQPKKETLADNCLAGSGVERQEGRSKAPPSIFVAFDERKRYIN